MAVSAERIAVGVTAVALNSEVGPVSGTKLVVTNDPAAGAEADLGPSDVTAGAGYPLAAGETVTVELGSGDQLFAITGSSTTLHVLRIG